jgi:hypothetical protein
MINAFVEDYTDINIKTIELQDFLRIALLTYFLHVLSLQRLGKIIPQLVKGLQSEGVLEEAAYCLDPPGRK